MIYTKLTKKAMQIAFDSHKAQVDKSGLPYIFHPFHLAEQMADEDSVCVALLHDVVEDTAMTLYDLRLQGFSYGIVDALRFLTHEKGIDYMEYVQNIKFNPLATKVKLADLRHNSDLTRLDVVDEKTMERVKKYQEAIALLSSAKNLKYHSPGKQGDTKYFKTEYSDIVKVVDGVGVYCLDDRGNFEPHQQLFSLWYDSMVDYKPMPYAEVGEEIEIRERLNSKQP